MRQLMFSLLAAALLAPAGARAGVFSDDMSKCLVAKTTDADQTLFMEWMFAAIAAHPAVRPLSNVSEAQSKDLTSKAGALMIRLVTVDCRQQTVLALKYEGAASFGNSFQLFGQVAMQGLMKDPEVKARLETLGKAVDENKLRDLFKEAGLSAPAK